MSILESPQGYELEKLLRKAFASGEEEDMRRLVGLAQKPHVFAEMTPMEFAATCSLVGEMSKFIALGGRA